MEQTTRSFRELFLRTVAIVGLIAVLVLGAWGIIILASNLVNIFGAVGSRVSSLFGGAKTEQVIVTAPQTIATGQPLAISWTHKNSDGAYSYAISYSCISGLFVRAPLPNGTVKNVACDTPFNFTNADAAMTVTPSNTGSQTLSTTFTVAATNLAGGAVTSSGNVTVAIAPKAATVQTSGTQTTAQPSYTYVPATQIAALYGLPDLSVRILSVMPQGSRVSVQFEIKNIGTNVARSGWSFNAQLPLNPSYTYQSQTQQALNPGDKIVYTLGFDNQYQGNQYYNYQYQYNYSTCYHYDGYQNTPYACPSNNYNSYNYGGYNAYPYGSRTVSVTADPFNWVQESAEYNNTASISI
jgi:hypothetical protein